MEKKRPTSRSGFSVAEEEDMGPRGLEMQKNTRLLD
jgi:hypothetical protein